MTNELTWTKNRLADIRQSNLRFQTICLLVGLDLASQNPCDRPVDHRQRQWLTFGHMHSHRKATCTLTNKHTHAASQNECSFPYRHDPHHLNLKKQWKHNEVKAAHTERDGLNTNIITNYVPASCFWKLELERKSKQNWTNKWEAAYLSNSFE